MIERFNFYDIYGYFLPGAAFLAVLWMPFGISKAAWPPSDWTSALIAATIAYFLGHWLQNIATNAIPSQRLKGQDRFPSDYFLDPSNSEIPKQIKEKIGGFMLSSFGLDLEVEKDGNQTANTGSLTIDKVRNNAFLLARQVLIQGEAVSYAEQFQGMYSLTRGLFAVFALATAYWAGWALAIESTFWMVRVAIIVLVLAVLTIIDISVVATKASNVNKKHKLEIAYALGLLLVFSAFGFLAGVHSRLTRLDAATFSAFAAFALLACMRFRSAYEFFAARFASTVWRDYVAFVTAQKAKVPIEDA